MMVRILQLGILFISSVAFASSTTIGKDGTLTITNEIISPDGFVRSASLVNGIHPGPVIAINKGDSVRLKVVNNLTDEHTILGTTVHWHGIFQHKTNFMDGMAGVTQCPIAPGNSFTYAFDTSTTGTYWYHSHFGLQYCDGVRGGFVIYDPDDPLRSMYDVDDESTIITLSDWLHTLAVDVVLIQDADSTLINGRGRYPGGPSVDLSVIKVQQSKRYRFRLISMSCSSDFTFSIDGHDLTVIEVEGTSTRPYTVNTLRILTGQRYSVVLNANQNIGNYWIRALPNEGNRGINLTYDNGINSAILRYAGAPILDPISEEHTYKVPFIEADLHPAVPSPPPGRHTPHGADFVFDLTFGLNDTTLLFDINGVPYKSPTIPVLLQILSGAKSPQQLLPEGSVYTVERNKTVQLNFPSGLRGGPHPLHLHGHNFWVVRSADTNKFNFENPITRDTVSAGDTHGDHVSIRFRTDNPGPWILHCHIDFHLNAGFALVFAEAPEDMKDRELIPPEEWDQLCPKWDALPDKVKHAGHT